MINNFKYQTGEKVKCIYTTLDNHEKLTECEVYTVVGASIVDGNVVFAVMDNAGKTYYSMDRFEKAWIPKEKPDMVVNPDYYKSEKVECIDALESATASLKGIQAVCTANVIKYLWRWKDKNGVEDLHKAKWYLEKLIKDVEAQHE